MRNQKNNQYEIKNKNLNYNYTIIPQAFIFDKRLSGNDLKLLCFYISVSINKNYSYYTNRKIQELLKISDKTITQSNRKLELLKYITIKDDYKVKEKGNTIIINKYKSNKDYDNFRYRKNYDITVGKITISQSEKLRTNKYKYNIINNDFNLKNKNEYTKRDDIEVAKIRKNLLKNNNNNI